MVAIVERNLQIVLAQKPAEDALGFFKPLLSLRQPVGLQAGGDGGAGLDRLLIEARLLRALDKESAGTDGHKDLRVAAMLLGDKPFRESIPAAIILLLLLRHPARISACGSLALEYERLFSNQCQVSE